MSMSADIKLDKPIFDLVHKSRIKRLTSIVNSSQPVNNDQARLTPIDVPSNTRCTSLDRHQLIAQRFTLIQRIGIGGFGEVMRS
jgi:hypothetical protein